jgi:hypothetical protein
MILAPYARGCFIVLRREPPEMSANVWQRLNVGQ